MGESEVRWSVCVCVGGGGVVEVLVAVRWGKLHQWGFHLLEEESKRLANSRHVKRCGVNGFYKSRIWLSGAPVYCDAHVCLCECGGEGMCVCVCICVC